MKFSENFLTFFLSIDLTFWVTGHLLCRLIPIKIFVPPVTCLICNLPEKSNASLFEVRSVTVVWFFRQRQLVLYFVNGTLVRIACAVLFFRCPSSFRTNKLFFPASIYVEPGCPKYSASSTCLFSSSETTMLSPAISKPNRSVISLKPERIFRELFLSSSF